MITPRLPSALLVAALLAPAAAAAPPAAFDVPAAPHASAVKQVQRRAMLARAAARLARLDEGRDRIRNGRPALPRGAAASRRPRLEPPPAATAAAAARAGLTRLADGGTPALGPNVRANDPAGDAPAHGQAEASLAALGDDVLVFWNDGAGFDLPAGDIQGGAYSRDGGATFTDFGVPPKPAGGWVWNSDPAVTVNEKTGVFYYCALVDQVVSGSVVANGIGIVSATFPSGGGPIQWGTPLVAIQSATIGFDKQWIAADSANNRVYISYTNFNSTTFSQIDFIRSQDGGLTFGPAQKLSSTAGDGWVHGSRVAVGPASEVYVIWSEIGQVDVDFFRIRRSTNNGTGFGVESTLPPYFANFGTGAPGFNRERGITFPSLAVDRSAGPHRGRLYVTWNETINWYDDIGVGGPGLADTEPNGTPGTAQVFALGDTIAGTCSSPTDEDWYRFTANQGDDIVMRCFTQSGLDLAWRLFCGDAATRLAISNLGTGEAYIVFTAPVTGTYYMRAAPFGGSGTYRIRTRRSTPGVERARDHRDVFVAWSANGGTTWSTPSLVNADAGHFDNWLPEVAVAGDGRPYVLWYDWRRSPPALCGALSDAALARSDDGGATWSELGFVTETSTNWTTTLSNIAPNQGDYLFLFAQQDRLHPVWYDGRAGNVDVFVSNLPLGPAAASVTLLSASATPSQATLTWRVFNAPGDSVRIHRRRVTGPDTVLALVAASAGVVTYTDTTVIAGETYFYRAVVIEDGLETPSAETAVPIPTGLDFAIRGVGANPVAGELLVTFVLPTAEPAALGLYDVTGRQIRRVALALGPGTHAERLLDPGHDVENGVYFLVLEQAGRRASRRVSIVR